MTTIRIQLPDSLIRELETELQGTRPHTDGGFIWYSRETGESVHFMTHTTTGATTDDTESLTYPFTKW